MLSQHLPANFHAECFCVKDQPVQIHDHSLGSRRKDIASGNNKRWVAELLLTQGSAQSYSEVCGMWRVVPQESSAMGTACSLLCAALAGTAVCN